MTIIEIANELMVSSTLSNEAANKIISIAAIANQKDGLSLDEMDTIKMFIPSLNGYLYHDNF